MTQQDIARTAAAAAKNGKGSDEPMLQFFSFQHLPPDLQKDSEPFERLAARIAETLPRNPERTVALRKLLEAKDCALRSRLFNGRSAAR
jgi:hypothetical protein